MMTLQDTAEIPEIFRFGLEALDAEIAALETLEKGLDGTIKQLMAAESQHRLARDGFALARCEPRSSDFQYVQDWHAAHAEWEHHNAKRTQRVAEETAAQDLAWRTYVAFVQLIANPMRRRVEELKRKRANITENRAGLWKFAQQYGLRA